MNELFVTAAENLLDFYGSDALLINGSVSESIRISPLFPAKLAGNEKLESDADVLIPGTVDEKKLIPKSTRLRTGTGEWTLVSVSAVGSAGSGKAFYELAIAR